MTIFWPEGAPIAVATDEAGIPRAILWQQARHPVRLVVEQWRVDMEWWERRVWREYFELLLRTGYWVVVYHDLLERRWYLQRQYD